MMFVYALSSDYLASRRIKILSSKTRELFSIENVLIQQQLVIVRKFGECKIYSKSPFRLEKNLVVLVKISHRDSHP